MILCCALCCVEGSLRAHSPTSLGRGGTGQVKNQGAPSGGVPAHSGAAAARPRSRGAAVPGGWAFLSIALHALRRGLRVLRRDGLPFLGVETLEIFDVPRVGEDLSVGVL